MLEELELAREPAAPLTARAAIHGLATAVPAGRLTSAELAERLGLPEDWILSRTGIRERPIAAPGERVSDYAARAGSAALRQAGVDAAEVDLVLVATMTSDELSPNAAPLVAQAIGAAHAGAIDLGAACTSFLSGLQLAAAQVEAGRARWVVLIGADFVSRITDFSDRRTAPLFSDAAGAVVVGPAGGTGGWIGPILLGCDGTGGEAIIVSHQDRLIRMDGQEVYRNAVARMSEYALATLQRAGTTLDEVDLFVPHQANARITRAVGERLGLPAEKVVDCIAGCCN